MDIQVWLERLEALGDPEAVQGMARFGINPQRVFGISIPVLRKCAKDIGKNRELAHQLWESGWHEARILASMIDDKSKVTSEQMDNWVRDLDSWDVCDQLIQNLFGRVPMAWEKAVEWSHDEAEFVKRAGYVMMARLAVTEKNEPDSRFIAFFPLIEAGAADNRNFVKKGVNWALRQIGKRNPELCEAAIEVANRINQTDSTSARWVASDALRELENYQFNARSGD